MIKFLPFENYDEQEVDKEVLIHGTDNYTNSKHITFSS